MSEARSWIDRIERRLARWRARGLGGTWVVAVSGGGDSVGLLRVLHQLAPAAGLRLSVAHLDHGVRGEAARADAAFVAELAGVARPAVRPGPLAADPRRPLRVRRPPRPLRLADRGRPVARRGRRGGRPHARRPGRDDPPPHPPRHRPARAGRHPARGGSLADGPRDQAGAPLLDVSRRRDPGLSPGRWASPSARTRPTPTSSRTRARIRHDLLPKLAAEYNPKVAEALVRLGELAAASRRAIEADVREMAAGGGHHPHRRIASCSSTAFLRSLPAFLRAEVLRRALAAAPAGPRRACRRGDGGGWPRWSRSDEIPRIEIGAGVAVSTESSFLVLHRSPAARAVAPAADSRRSDRAGHPRLGGRSLGRRPDRGDARSRRAGRRVDRPRPARAAACRPRPGAGRSVRAAGDGRPEHAAGRLLPRPGRPARSAGPHPARLRPARHRLGRRPSDRRPGQGDRRDPATLGLSWHEPT